MYTKRTLVLAVISGFLFAIGGVVLLYAGITFLRENAPVYVVDGDGKVRVFRTNEGFRVDVAINEYTLRFVVDTGADLVVMNEKDAREIGDLVVHGMTVTKTANGDVRGRLVRIPRVKVGGLFTPDVEAVILESPTEPLLGLSFLERFRFEHERGVIILRPHN